MVYASCRLHQCAGVGDERVQPRSAIAYCQYVYRACVLSGGTSDSVQLARGDGDERVFYLYLAPGW